MQTLNLKRHAHQGSHMVARVNNNANRKAHQTIQKTVLVKKLLEIKAVISSQRETLQHRAQKDDHHTSLAINNHVTLKVMRKTHQANFYLKLLGIKLCRNLLYLRRLALTAISQIVKTPIM